MVTYNLFNKVNELQNELHASLGSRNLIQVNFDEKLPKTYEGDLNPLLSRVKKLADVLAERLVNGVLQIEFRLNKIHQRNVIAEVRIVGSGINFSQSSGYDSIKKISNEIKTITKDQHISLKKVDSSLILVFFSNLLTLPGSPKNGLLAFKGKKILIVEDNPANNIVFTSFLEDWGVHYTTVFNGLSGVDFASSREFDGILMDIHMPIMDGIEAIHKIRETNKKIPIIVLSGIDRPEEIDTALKAGANDFLKKPVSSAELLSVLSTYLKD